MAINDAATGNWKCDFRSTLKAFDLPRPETLSRTNLLDGRALGGKPTLELPQTHPNVNKIDFQILSSKISLSPT